MAFRSVAGYAIAFLCGYCWTLSKFYKVGARVYYLARSNICLRVKYGIPGSPLAQVGLLFINVYLQLESR